MQINVFTLTIVVALLWRYKSKGFSELIEELGCHDTEFRLSCESLKANLAIFEATFSQDDSYLEAVNTSCGNPGHPTNKTAWKYHKLKTWENFFQRKNNSNGAIEVSFRHAINRRCSGVNYCSFVLSEDFEAASSLGPGAVYLRYACVDDLRLTRACNSNIDVSDEGFVKTPGYPDYYIGDSTCLWTLRAHPPQRVKVAFLDVSLRGIAPFEGACLDWLIVAEDGLNLLSTCGDVVEDTSILSDGPVLNVSFKTSSKTLFPKRGFLFHYKAVGCPSLQKPRDGYLINRNESFAHYRCCVGFVFPDTLSRDKVLKCFNENTWDGVVTDCVNVTELLKEKNVSVDIIKELAAEARAAMETNDFMKDIIIPSVVMCVLFIGNGILVYVIHRKRKKLARIEKMEMKQFQDDERSKRGEDQNLPEQVNSTE